MPSIRAPRPPLKRVEKTLGMKGNLMASSAMSHTVDVLVVGSGAGAMTAALAAAKAGLDTLSIEKANVYGGSSATSGGGLWITCNHLMPGVGMEDNDDDAIAYMTALTGNDVPPANV